MFLNIALGLFRLERGLRYQSLSIPNVVTWKHSRWQLEEQTILADAPVVVCVLRAYIMTICGRESIRHGREDRECDQMPVSFVDET